MISANMTNETSPLSLESKECLEKMMISKGAWDEKKARYKSIL